MSCFGFLEITSFIIHYLDWQAGNDLGSVAPYSDYPLTGCSREMRPLAFPDPSAFIGSNLQPGGPYFRFYFSETCFRTDNQRS